MEKPVCSPVGEFCIGCCADSQFSSFILYNLSTCVKSVLAVPILYSSFFTTSRRVSSQLAQFRLQRCQTVKGFKVKQFCISCCVGSSHLLLQFLQPLDVCQEFCICCCVSCSHSLSEFSTTSQRVSSQLAQSMQVTKESHCERIQGQATKQNHWTLAKLNQGFSGKSFV